MDFHSKHHSKDRPPKPRQPPPINVAISTWLISFASLSSSDEKDSIHSELLKKAPKRFTIYEPMALLPAGSFTLEPWPSTLQRLDQKTCQKLWSLILGELSKGAGSTLKHLAVTEGIPLRKDGTAEEENVLRSPSGLRMLYGNFGPAIEFEPGIEDFEKTLWVSTKQNGIKQTWAPRWTMFSRGNVKEKARVLSFPPSANKWAVDLYAGIGYFVFSYVQLGKRVLCWEINPWSVEGLRRGALANRWSVRVIQGAELDKPFVDGGEQIIVFLESNEQARERIRKMQDIGMARDIGHVNCGFLPTSESTWKLAWDVVEKSEEAWLHLHENVGVDDTDDRWLEIQRRCEEWAEGEGHERIGKAEHVELVKTFAPGVWHCVFDVHITKCKST